MEDLWLLTGLTFLQPLVYLTLGFFMWFILPEQIVPSSLLSPQSSTELHIFDLFKHLLLAQMK